MPTETEIREICKKHNFLSALDMLDGGLPRNRSDRDEATPSVVYTRLGAFQNKHLRYGGEASMEAARNAHIVRTYIAEQYLQ